MTQFNFEDFNIINVYQGGEAEMQLNKNYITFTRALLADMGNPAYVRLLLHPQKHIFALQACDQQNRSAFKFSRPKNADPNARHTSSKILHTALVAAMGDAYQPGCCYGFKGTFDAESKAMIFDLNSAYVRSMNMPPEKSV